MAQPNLQALLAPGARARNLDLNALLAIASHEGASGRIGDGGHAFGPFQMNDAGGVLTGKLNGLTPQQKNAWAWSPQGIKFAEDSIARVAAGERGAQAVRDIATRFERPANVGAEISDALAHYGGSGPQNVPVRTLMSVGAAPAPSPGAAPTDNPLSGLLGQLVGQTNQSLGLGDGTSDLAGLLANAAFGTPKPKPGKPGQGMGGLTPKPIGGNAITGLKFQGDTAGEQPGFLGKLSQAARAVGAQAIRINSGYRTPTHNAAIGGVQGSLHTKGLAMDGEALISGRWVPLGIALKPVAPRFGLRSGAVPGFFNGKPDPVHVDAGFGVR